MASFKVISTSNIKELHFEKANTILHFKEGFLSCKIIGKNLLLYTIST